MKVSQESRSYRTVVGYILLSLVFKTTSTVLFGYTVCNILALLQGLVKNIITVHFISMNGYEKKSINQVHFPRIIPVFQPLQYSRFGIWNSTAKTFVKELVFFDGLGRAFKGTGDVNTIHDFWVVGTLEKRFSYD